MSQLERGIKTDLIMDIINKTKCPLSILGPFLENAARAVGVDLSAPLGVKVTQGHGGKISGVAYNTPVISIKLVLPKLTKYTRGAIAMFNGKRLPNTCPLDLALRFWRVAAHEWGHVFDYQAIRQGKRRVFQYYADDQSTRAIAHDERPQEIRADLYAADAEVRAAHSWLTGYEDVVLALAEWFEK